MNAVDVLIIGAGPAGLTLGKLLSEKKISYLIVEKSRGVGGRVATRRIHDIKFDHGAPFLKTNRELLELISEMNFSTLNFGEHGFFFQGGMTSLFKKISEDLPIRKEVKIVRLEKRTFNWTAVSDKNEEFHAQIVVNTAPLPQALLLLKESQLGYWHDDELDSIQYSKALMGLFLTNENVKLGKSKPGEVHSVFSMEDRTHNPSAWILRTTPTFSDTHFEEPENVQLQKITQLFRESVEGLKDISYAEVKKWRYVLPEKVLPYPYLEVLKDLYLIGDAFRYPDVQGSLQGAHALAKKL